MFDENRPAQYAMTIHTKMVNESKFSISITSMPSVLWLWLEPIPLCLCLRPKGDTFSDCFQFKFA